jgi:peptide/nickel transport system substrate-binding protein
MRLKHTMSTAAVLTALSALSALSLMGTVQAQTVRIGNQGDALSMDPHSLNESLQLSVTNNIYEPLVGRDRNLNLAPALATSWKQTSPTVWRFELRKGVKFHDGKPFTADDVLFSFRPRRRRRFGHEELHQRLQGSAQDQ